MQITWKILGAASVCALALSGLCHAASTVAPAALIPSAGSDRSAITAQYVQLTTAFAQGDIARVKDILTPNYTETDPGGKVLDRVALCAKLSSERKQITSVTTDFTITNLSATSSGIVADVHTHSSGTGSKHVLFFTFHGKFDNDMIVEDLWTQSSSGWRLAYRHTLYDRSTQSAA